MVAQYKIGESHCFIRLLESFIVSINVKNQMLYMYFQYTIDYSFFGGFG